MKFTLLEALRQLVRMQHPAPGQLLRRHGYSYEGDVIDAITQPLAAVFALPEARHGSLLQSLLGIAEPCTDLSPEVCAAFIQEGLMRNGSASYGRLLSAWSRGALELVTEASRYASYAVTLAEAWSEADDGHPGVYAYEVCAPFGTWFAEFVEKHRRAPEPEQARHMLEALAETFFQQSATVEEVTA